MKTILQVRHCMIGCLLLLFVTSCALAAPITSTHTIIRPEPTFVSQAELETLRSPAEATELTVEMTGGIVYANVDHMASELDVYAPNEPGPWPVVVIVHGAFQKRRALWKLIDAIASQGAVVYSLDVEHSFPYATSAFDRIACGVRFARATAADYGGDPSWITLFGYSAGAHGGAVIALTGDEFAGDCVVMDESALVDAFVAYEGPYDWTTTVYHNAFDFTNLKNEDPELWHAINPNSQIGQNPELQVRLLHGDAEDVEWYDVPLEVSIEFHQALTEAGYDVALMVAEGGTHGAIIDSSEVIALTVGQVMELAHSSSE